MKYRKKPVIVEAHHFGIDRWLPDWYMDRLTANVIVHHAPPNAGWKAKPESASIKTNHGIAKCEIGDYIILTEAGEVYPCSSEEFNKNYERAE